jgi:hypothetical protein
MHYVNVVWAFQLCSRSIKRPGQAGSLPRWLFWLVMPSILFLSTWMICSREKKKKKSNFTNMLKVIRIRNVPSFFAPPRSAFRFAWAKK